MNVALPLLVSALALASMLDAQTSTIHPSGFDNVDANASTTRPFSVASATPSARQYHWQSMRDLTGKSGVIREFALRRDQVDHAGGAGVAFWVDVEIALSTAKTTLATMDKTFANNEGQDRTVVIAQKRINFPSYPFVNNTAAQPFVYKLPFDSGKFFRFAGGLLCIDIQVFDNNLYDATTSKLRNHDFDEAYATTQSATANSRRGCYTSDSTQWLPVHGYTYANFDTTNLQYQLYGYTYYGLPGSSGVQIAALRPLAASLRISGTDCYLHVDPTAVVWILPGAPTANSGATYYYPPYVGATRQYVTLPNHAALNGLVLYTQYLVLDPAANGAGFATSPLNTMIFPRQGDLGIAVVYDYGSGFSNATARYSYSVASGRGPMLKITY